MDNGMWVIGLFLIPIIISIISFIFALFLIFNMKKKKKKSIPKIILTILLLIPMFYMIFVFATSFIDIISNNTKPELCENIEKLSYKIEQVDKWNYDIYIYDNDGNYYDTIPIYYDTIHNHYIAEPDSYEYDTETKERCSYLYKSIEGTISSIRVNLKDTTKFYIKDPTGNKILIWDYNDYLSAFAVQNLEIQKAGNEFYIKEESLKNITIDYNDRFFDYHWVIKRDGIQILARAMSPQNLTLNLLDLKEEFYKPSGSYEIYLETYSEWEEAYIKASNSIVWSK